jgi:hypothetical protein
MKNGSYLEVRIKGKAIRVPSACISDRTVVASGNWLKIAAVADEELVEGETVQNPELFVAGLKSSDLKVDIFTFAQKVPDAVPKYNYHLEFDNAAVIPITSFSYWWEKRAEYDVRKAVKRAKRLGVVVKPAEFNDAFVEGICRIYNETPVRQGKAFWHFQKKFDAVKRENSTYLDRSAFIGAYYNNELIGFIKMVYVGPVATTLQVISQQRHFDKKPTNALIAKAVEICELKGVTHLIYGSYVYQDRNSSLTEFKRRNGFEQVLLPRYYIPLTAKGKLALKLDLHHQLANRIPEPMASSLRKLRTLWYNRRFHAPLEAS